MTQSLLATNDSLGLLEIGWLERPPEGALYDTASQTLISFSMAHDTLFNSGDGRVIVGAFSFIVPGNSRKSARLIRLTLGTVPQLPTESQPRCSFRPSAMALLEQARSTRKKSSLLAPHNTWLATLLHSVGLTLAILATQICKTTTWSKCSKPRFIIWTARRSGAISLTRWIPATAQTIIFTTATTRRLTEL